MKVVINSCYGGFGLSLKAQYELAKLKGINLYFYKEVYINNDYKNKIYKKVDIDKLDSYLFIFSLTKDYGDEFNKYDSKDYYNIEDKVERHDEDLIYIVENLKETASGNFSNLKVIEIPDDVEEYEIDEYDGLESIHEVHRSWS